MTDSGPDIETLQKKSFWFYGKAVVVALKADSASGRSHGGFVEGKLVARIWGNCLNKESKLIVSVVAVKLSVSDTVQITIPCEDILSIEEPEDESR